MRILDKFWVVYSEKDRRIWSKDDIITLEYPTLYPSYEIAQEISGLVGGDYRPRKVLSLEIEDD